MRKFISKLLIGIMTVSLMGNSFLPNIKVMAAENTGVEALADNNSDTSNEDVIDLSYHVHCEQYGWLEPVSSGKLSGTEGESKRLEGIKIYLDTNLEGSIEYEVHCEQYGWMGMVEEGVMAGTEGESKRLESIRIKLTGELGEKYDVIYRVHCETYGWTDWVSNGMDAGTVGQSKRLEAIQINIVKKEGNDKEASIKYTTHVEKYGWLEPVGNGEMSGTEGESKRLEGIKIDIINSDYVGGVAYKVHAEKYGWMDWMTNYNMSGTKGESKRLEAIQIMLTGELSAAYDVYYRVHCEKYGWLGWAMNGQVAGSSGLSKRLEGIEIALVKKGGEAPGTTDRPYVYPALLEQEEQEQESGKTEEEVIIPPSEEPIVPGVPTDSTEVEDILNSAQLYEPCYTGDKEIDARVQEILGQIITEDMTTYEKTLAIYNWIIDNTYYDWHASNFRGNYVSDFDTWCVSQSYSVLCLGYGSCVNYASAFVVLTRAIGLESYKVYGALYSANVNRDHGWAVVNINGTLYTFDPQLSDEAEGNGWGDAMDYFCKDDEHPNIKNYYVNVDVCDPDDPEDDLYRADYINGFNYFKQY
ncbi:MAG: hypothetical protein IKJ73_02730 [Lachnospiraceae bacterium]|nr:hypothetical protein [Lachnospiraceae bacterium]